MRLVTWNINGLGSLKFPFHIHAHHSHRYPTLDGSSSKGDDCSAAAVHDPYDYDETTLPSSDSTTEPASSNALLSRNVSGSNGTGSANDTSSAAAVSPHDPSFPAFPSSCVLLSDELVASYDELIGYFQADIVCLQEVKIGRGRMDLLAKAVSWSRNRTAAREEEELGIVASQLQCCRHSLTLCAPCCVLCAGVRPLQPATTRSSRSAASDQSVTQHNTTLHPTASYPSHH